MRDIVAEDEAVKYILATEGEVYGKCHCNRNSSGVGRRSTSLYKEGEKERGKMYWMSICRLL